MKRFLLLAALWIGVVILMPAAMTNAADIKIGLIDAQKIMRESKAAKKARAIFFRDLEKKRTVFKEKQDDVRSLQEKLRKEGKSMSPEARREKAEKLEKELKELRRLKSDLEDELKKKDLELTRKLLREIKEVVQEFSKKKKYTVILEKKSVVVADEAIDITDQIIKLYDAQKR